MSAVVARLTGTRARHLRKRDGLEGKGVTVDDVPVQHVHLCVGHGVEVLEDDLEVV